MMSASRLLRRARLAVFSLCLLGPALAWAVTGPVESFGGRRQAEFPEVADVIGPGAEARAQLTDAVLDRSWLRRTALGLRSGFDFFLFGQADQDNAVSGLDGWLFYRPQFEAWNCEAVDQVRDGLEALRFQSEFAAAGDLPVLFAIAPNKASVERDRVGGRAAREMDACYDQVEADLRRMTREDQTGRLVDHTALLQNLDSPERRFYRYDTHWRPWAALEAFNQLAGHPVYPSGLPLEHPQFETVRQRPDIARRILALPVTEAAEYPVVSPVNWDETEERARFASIVVSHDSFYGSIRDILEARMAAPVLVHQGLPEMPDLSEALAEADLLIVERVERHLHDQFGRWAEVGGEAAIHAWLLERSALAARRCAWDEALDLMPGGTAAEADFRRMENLPAGGMQTRGSNARIHFTPPAEWGDAPVCVRASVTATRDEQSWVFVPGALLSDARYVNGRSLHIPLEEGANEIAFVLPASVAGENLRWDPVRSNRPVTVTALEIAPRFGRSASSQPD